MQLTFKGFERGLSFPQKVLRHFHHKRAAISKNIYNNMKYIKRKSCIPEKQQTETTRHFHKKKQTFQNSAIFHVC